MEVCLWCHKPVVPKQNLFIVFVHPQTGKHYLIHHNGACNLHTKQENEEQVKEFEGVRVSLLEYYMKRHKRRIAVLKIWNKMRAYGWGWIPSISCITLTIFMVVMKGYAEAFISGVIVGIAVILTVRG